MTNEERYITPEGRLAAFREYCDRHRKKFNGCTIGNCPLRTTSTRACQFLWLALEAEEEKPSPCPFCDGKAIAHKDLFAGGYRVRCMECNSMSNVFTDKEAAIAAWNRRVK